MPLLSKKIMGLVQEARIEENLQSLLQFDSGSPEVHAAITLRKALIDWNDQSKKTAQLLNVINKQMAILSGHHGDGVPVVYNQATYEIAKIIHSIVSQMSEKDLPLFVDTQAAFLSQLTSKLQQRIKLFEWVKQGGETAEKVERLNKQRKQWFEAIQAKVEKFKPSTENNHQEKINFSGEIYDEFRTYVANGLLLANSVPYMCVMGAKGLLASDSTNAFYAGFSPQIQYLGKTVVDELVGQQNALNFCLAGKGLAESNLVEIYIRQSQQAESSADDASSAEKRFDQLIETFCKSAERYVKNFKDLRAGDLSIEKEVASASAATPTRSDQKAKHRSRSKRIIMTRCKTQLARLLSQKVMHLQQAINGVAQGLYGRESEGDCTFLEGVLIQKKTMTTRLEDRVHAMVVLLLATIQSHDELVASRSSWVHGHRRLKPGQVALMLNELLDETLSILIHLSLQDDESLLEQFPTAITMTDYSAGGGDEEAGPFVNKRDKEAIKTIQELLSADYGEAGPLKAVDDEIKKHLSSVKASQSTAALRSVADNSGQQDAAPSHVVSDHANGI